MSGATAEALAWEKRANEEEAQGVRVGNREICRRCLRPLRMGWGSIPACRHFDELPSKSAAKLHGLGGLTDLPLGGVINRD